MKASGKRFDMKYDNFRENYLTIVSSGERVTTPFHEIGHMVEWANPELVRLEKEFVEYKAKGEGYSRLKDVFSLTNYRADEVVKRMTLLALI